MKKILASLHSPSSDTILNIRTLRKPENLKNKEDIYAWIKEGISYFKEWYQPVDFGNGVIAYQTTPPDWKPKPELINDKGGGLAKWEYIVKKHIPNVKDKRILDLGCSSGLFSIEIARMGAKEVIGIDRNTNIRHRSSDVSPRQDVSIQADFVKKAFELLNETHFPITYIAHDIGQLEKLKLGNFDLIIALNIVYHEMDQMPRLLNQLATMTNHLILQTSLGHGGKLGEWSAVGRQIDTLIKAGFTKIEIDSPIDYLMPMIIALK